MRLTIVGSGDAFGSGGRTNTFFFLETARGTAGVLVAEDGLAMEF